MWIDKLDSQKRKIFVLILPQMELLFHILKINLFYF